MQITAMTPESKVISNQSFRCIFFLTEALYILYNNCQYDIGAKGEGQNNLILVVLLEKQIHISNMFCRRWFIFCTLVA